MKHLPAILLVLCATATVRAQNADIEALSGLQFNFGTPGARSLGMGGAFIGSADDASAAEANPAGLTVLRKSELSLEMRQVNIAQRFVTGGTYPFVTSQDFPARETAPAFASVVFPLKPVVLAAYYHRALSYQNDVDLTGRYDTPTFHLGPNGPLPAEQCGAGCTTHKIYPFSTSADLQMETFGLAIARQWRKFSLGGAVRYHRFHENADTFRRDVDAPGQPLFVVAQMNASGMFGKSADRDVTFVAGALWSPTEKIGVGLVFKKGPTFPVAVVAAKSLDTPPQLVGSSDFHVPTTVGAGISYRPVGNLTMNLDLVRVGYAKLSDRFISVIEYGTEGESVFDSVQGYETKNGTEIHAGAEYFILTRVPVALRCGWWRDPPHAIAYRGPMATAHEIAARILFPGTDAENHYSVGFGVALPHIGIDFAYDTSRSLRTASMWFVMRR